VRFTDFIALMRAVRHHLAATGHTAERFDTRGDSWKGYHCVECGALWRIENTDLYSYVLRMQNILTVLGDPELAFNVFEGILNSQNRYFEEDGHCLIPPVPDEAPPSPESSTRFERDEPL
jgi:hypothetical protein